MVAAPQSTAHWSLLAGALSALGASVGKGGSSSLGPAVAALRTEGLTLPAIRSAAAAVCCLVAMVVLNGMALGYQVRGVGRRREGARAAAVLDIKRALAPFLAGGAPVLTHTRARNLLGAAARDARLFGAARDGAKLWCEFYELGAARSAALRRTRCWDCFVVPRRWPYRLRHCVTRCG